ncbi:MAG: pyridoxal-phosphate dependent enzyme [Weeksellaceae bacterium]|nr:pyridoxal-phosphate dependent enzyme [Weeksellaceae bacterium]
MAVSSLSIIEFFDAIPAAPIQYITHVNGVELCMLRADLNHPMIMGNKLYKLKYNLLQAAEPGCDGLVTFGGAFSNHLVAVAAAGDLFGFETWAFVRGDELVHKKLNPTLQFAKEHGMQLSFVTRAEYRNKASLLDVVDKKKYYVVPEGGTNALAVKGVGEMLHAACRDFDFIATAVGTGGTCAGLLAASDAHQKIIGVSVLKGATYLLEEMAQYASLDNLEFVQDYHFGGYGKFNKELIKFVQEFHSQHKVWLEPIYTGKMMYGVYEMLQESKFPSGSKVLVVHTGGLQVNQSIVYD